MGSASTPLPRSRAIAPRICVRLLREKAETRGREREGKGRGKDTGPALGSGADWREICAENSKARGIVQMEDTGMGFKMRGCLTVFVGDRGVRVEATGGQLGDRPFHPERGTFITMRGEQYGI